MRTLSGSRADAERVDPELGGSCGDASVLLSAGEDLCGVVAPRRCLGPTRPWTNIYLWCLLFVDSRVPLGLLDPHGLAFFGPCLPAISERVRVLNQSSYENCSSSGGICEKKKRLDTNTSLGVFSRVNSYYSSFRGVKKYCSYVLTSSNTAVLYEGTA